MSDPAASAFCLSTAGAGATRVSAFNHCKKEAFSLNGISRTSGASHAGSCFDPSFFFSMTASGTASKLVSNSNEGTSGTSGTGFDTVQNPALTRVLTSDGTPNGAIAQSGLTYDFDTQLLSVSGAVQFDTTDYTGGTAEGRLSWNPTDGTLDLGMKGGLVTQQIGQEVYYPPVVNKTGGILYQGTLVMINGTTPSFGNRLNVVKAISDGTVPSFALVGILTEDIADNQEGFATWFGYVRNLNENDLESEGIKPVSETWVEGDILWANPTLNGGLTKVEPSAPNLKVPVAAITDINGVNITLMVRPRLTPSLGDINNVQTSGETHGDLVVYNNTLGYWEYTKTLEGDYTISGNTTQYGDQFIHSAEGLVLTTGTYTLETVPVTSGKSIQFDYVVYNDSEDSRAGTVIVVWNSTTATLTDNSTPDINGVTDTVKFDVTNDGTNVRLNVVTGVDGWSVVGGTRVIF